MIIVVLLFELSACDISFNESEEEIIKLVVCVRDEMKEVIENQISNISVDDSKKKLQIEVVSDVEESDIFVFESKDYENNRKNLLKMEKDVIDIKMRNIFSSYSLVMENDTLLAYPFAVKLNLLFYNEMFYNKDEVKSLEKMMYKDVGEERINFAFDISDVSIAPSFFVTNGINIFEKGFNVNSATSSMEYLIRLYQNNKFSNLTLDNSLLEFEKGNLGAIITNVENYTKIKSALKDNFSVAVLPTISVEGDDISLLSFMTNYYFGINKKTKNKSLAMSLCNFLTNEDTQSKLIDLGFIPCNNNLLESKAIKNQLFNVSKNQIENSVELPKISFEDNFLKVYLSFSNDILSGVTTKSNMKKKLEDFAKIVS